jgi:MYXO-CTERM domain-containing protein
MRYMFLTAVLAVSAAASAHADVVINGGFELPINAANGWTTNTGFTQNALGTTVITPRTGSFYTGATSSSNTTRTNTISQSLSLNAGDVVDFGMFYELANTSASAAVTVTLDGNVIYTNTLGAGNILTWTAVSAPGITIANNSPLLSISQTVSGRTNSFCFDDVSVTLVPAPASAMLGLSALGMVARRRRR